MTASAFDACKLFPEMIQYFWIYVDHLRMYLKAVPVGAGAVFLFDRFLKIGYICLTRQPIRKVKASRSGV